LFGSGGTLTAIDVAAWGLELPIRIGLDNAGDAAFLAATPSSLFGVFATDPSGAGPSVHYAPEAGSGLADSGAIVGGKLMSLAQNGTLAFSSIHPISGAGNEGALYRGPVTGSVVRVVSSSDVAHPYEFGFHEAERVDVNASGQIAVDMAHITRCGFTKRDFVFDTPEPSLENVSHAVTGIFYDAPLETAINDAGLVAFSLADTAPSMTSQRCPPAGYFERTILATGVYTALPTVFTELPSLALLVDNAGPFASFGAVDINNAGVLVFEATLDDGLLGIFKEPDPEFDKILLVGDTLGGEVVTSLQLGQLNDAGELAVATESASGRSIWRVDGIAP
jgi:hypothetical protein